MIIKKYPTHVDIIGDSDICLRAVKRAGFKIEPTDSKYKNEKVELDDLKRMYEKAWRTGSEADALVYMVAKVNYIQENDHRTK